MAKRLPPGWLRDSPEWTLESGQAWVYRVRRPNDGRLYALKRWKNSTRLDRFAREINAMVVLRERELAAILEVVDYGLGNNPWPYLITPWYANGSLADRIAAGILGNEIAKVALCRVLAQALYEVHRQGYAHRDLKPQNILFKGDAPRLVLQP